MKKQIIKIEYENEHDKKTRKSTRLQSAGKEADLREQVKKSMSDFGYTSRDSAALIFKKEKK